MIARLNFSLYVLGNVGLNRLEISLRLSKSRLGRQGSLAVGQVRRDFALLFLQKIVLKSVFQLLPSSLARAYSI